MTRKKASESEGKVRGETGLREGSVKVYRGSREKPWKWLGSGAGRVSDAAGRQGS